jgi:hypothetical protein
MTESIERLHNRIIDKITLIKKCVDAMQQVDNIICTHKFIRNITLPKVVSMQLVQNVEDNYRLSIVNILTEYYSSGESEEKATSDFYRVISHENIPAQLDTFVSEIQYYVDDIHTVIGKFGQHRKTVEGLIDTIIRNVDCAYTITITVGIEKRNYEWCKCGSRMVVRPELSELHCPNPICNKVKTIIGAVFKDDQFYPQEGQKTKHGGYMTSRHYRFWIERLQAIESANFTKYEISCIEYILERDKIPRHSLTCEIMRNILKDPIVSATTLNDHAPLLVKLFGGRPPPLLSFQENRTAAIKFNKAMILYDKVHPNGGNKPYYPYFIYKIFEYMFKDNKEKIRLLDYIHLQSRETVIKNDKSFEKMCEIANPEDNFYYKPTDPAGRL